MYMLSSYLERGDVHVISAQGMGSGSKKYQIRHMICDIDRGTWDVIFAGPLSLMLISATAGGNTNSRIR